VSTSKLPRTRPIPSGTMVTVRSGLTGTAMSQKPGMVSGDNPITGTLREGEHAVVISFMAREQLMETHNAFNAELDEAFILSSGPLARLGWVAANDLARV
jgi:hypothetical protein